MLVLDFKIFNSNFKVRFLNAKFKFVIIFKISILILDFRMKKLNLL